MRRTIKRSAKPSTHFTREEAREAVRSVGEKRKARDFAERFIEKHPETFKKLADS